MSNELRGRESYNLQVINSTNPIRGHNFFNVEVTKVDSCSTLSILIYIYTYIYMVYSNGGEFTNPCFFRFQIHSKVSLFESSFMNLNFGMGYCCLNQSPCSFI